MTYRARELDQLGIYLGTPSYLPLKSLGTQHSDCPITATVLSSSIKLILCYTFHVAGFVPEHVTTFIVRLCSYRLILARRDVENVKVLTAPGRTSHIVRREDDVFQMLAAWTKDHDPKPLEHCYPQISIRTSK